MAGNKGGGHCDARSVTSLRRWRYSAAGWRLGQPRQKPKKEKEDEIEREREGWEKRKKEKGG